MLELEVESSLEILFGLIRGGIVMMVMNLLSLCCYLLILDHLLLLLLLHHHLLLRWAILAPYNVIRFCFGVHWNVVDSTR